MFDGLKDNGGRGADLMMGKGVPLPFEQKRCEVERNEEEHGDQVHLQSSDKSPAARVSAASDWWASTIMADTGTF